MATCVLVVSGEWRIVLSILARKTSTAGGSKAPLLFRRSMGLHHPDPATVYRRFDEYNFIPTNVQAAV